MPIRHEAAKTLASNLVTCLNPRQYNEDLVMLVASLIQGAVKSDEEKQALSKQLTDAVLERAKEGA